MLAIFFKINNSRALVPRTVAEMDDVEIVSQIKTLDENEYSVYEMSGKETKSIGSFKDYIDNFNNERGVFAYCQESGCVSVNLTEEEYLKIKPKTLSVVVTFTVKAVIKGKDMREITNEWRNTEINDMNLTFFDDENFYVEDANGVDVTADFLKLCK